MEMPPFERYRPIVDDWEAFMDVLRQPLPVAVWANTLRTDPSSLARVLARAGQEVLPLAWRPGAFRLPPEAAPGTLLAYLAGHLQIQEEASMVPVRLLDPRPGERVLDLCAAPGNKTAEIAVAMGNTGTVIANDLSRGRLHILRTTLDRLGLVNVTITRGDAAAFPLEAGSFDRVLCDVPCSCEGTVRKHPGVVRQSGPAFSRRLHERQRAILHRAVELTRPGGRIVYATCTFAPEENEAVVAAVLSAFPGQLRLLPARLPGLHLAPGLTAWAGQRFPDDLGLTGRLWPHHNDTGGFFVAVLEKTDGAERTAPPPAAFPAMTTPAAVEALCQHFGLAPEALASYALFRPNQKYLALTSADHRPPAVPEREATGMNLLKTTLRYPKLTTQAAMLLGGDVSRNVVNLSWQDTLAYLNRDVVHPGAGAREDTEPLGYVLVRHAGMPLGLGLLDRRAGPPTLKSLFPRSWGGLQPPFNFPEGAIYTPNA
ncbi:MAG: hypothetical protein KatS3mg044_1354 [Rhodothermaceae bacterium]|nr:MAG: hypothetical protein KatS3mg044_1354 [Rhodothermaceae bacterium]